MNRDQPASTTFQSPADGSYTILDAYDFHRKHNPKEPLYVFSADKDLEEPTKVTFEEFGRASDRMAEFIRPRQSASSTSDGRVVALILVADLILYQAAVVGIMKAGFVPLPISHRLTPKGVATLLEESSCHDIISAPKMLPGGFLGDVAQELRLRCPDYVLQIHDAPSVDDIYPNLGELPHGSFESYPLPNRPDIDDVVVYHHSSGSTGPPKLIPQTHRIVSHWASINYPAFTAHNPRLRYAAMAFPPFHALGWFAYTLLPAYYTVSIGVYPPANPTLNIPLIVPSPENVLEHTRRTKSTGVFIVPAFLHVLVQSESAIKDLASLEHVMTGGGTLSKNVGDSLAAAGVNIQSAYGGTEFGPPTLWNTHRGKEKDWDWSEFSDMTEVQWVDQGDGTYECHFMICATHRPAVVNRPDGRGYATSDLFIKHPTNDKLWKIIGRLDDVVIHSSGEKTVPGPMEDIINSSPMVQAALIFGRGHDNAGVLIEPRPDLEIDVKDGKALAGLRNLLWPVIEEANRIAPKYSQIFKEMILFTSNGKVLHRTPKGTVMRKTTLRMYGDEIEALYKDVATSAGSGAEDVEPPSDWELPIIEEWLRKQISYVLNGATGPLSITKDLFEQGLDSLSSTFLRLRILNAMRTVGSSATNAVTLNMIYANPTIEKLARHLSSAITNSNQTKSEDELANEIDAMIQEYSVGLSPVVLLTGSTGQLGSQILAGLLKDRNVQRIYACNRPASRSIIQRHSDRFNHMGLDDKLLDSEKLRFVQPVLSEKDLGLSEALYTEIQRSVTIIIHTSWKIDFNLTLPAFESHIKGVRNLIDLARGGPHVSTLRFIFTSSIASAQSWGRTRGPYPEKVIRQSKFAVGSGYGESKYIAERILERSGLKACSLRVGQLSGSSTKGSWAISEWFPILVKSSVALGGFPDALGYCSWLPMDHAAQAILDLAHTKKKLPFTANLIHPRPVSWNFLIKVTREVVVDALKMEPCSLPLIPLSEWVDRLSAKAKIARPEDFDAMPALKLVSFFQGMAEVDQLYQSTGKEDVEFSGVATLGSGKAAKLSGTIRTIPSLQIGDVKKWVEYWMDIGHLPKS